MFGKINYIVNTDALVCMQHFTVVAGQGGAIVSTTSYTVRELPDKPEGLWDEWERKEELFLYWKPFTSFDLKKMYLDETMWEVFNSLFCCTCCIL